MDKEEEDTEEDKNDMICRKDRQRNDHTKEIGIAARRYSQRDCRLGAIPLPESVFKFILFQEGGRMTEITFGFPGVFRQRVPFPCGQVQSASSGAFVRKDCLYFVFFFIIYDVRRQRRERRSI